METRTLLERTLSATLSESFGKRVVVFFSGYDLLIFRERSKDGSADLEQLPTGRLSRKLLRLCRYRVGTELQKRKSLVELDYLKTLQGTIVRGTTDRVRDNGSLIVLIRMDELFRRREVSGICPLKLQPQRERGRYCIGDAWYFYVTRVSLICLAGRERLCRVDVILSRTSRLLPELLLKMKSGSGDISCPRRIAGKISFVSSKQRLPREAIQAVSKELGERVKVRWES
ncbi:MAG: hypothetical protein HXX11_17310 [Desulfuromonadales bacterium]|nr:hypothetical protein [Desulfuromonadales bacterium]